MRTIRVYITLLFLAAVHLQGADAPSLRIAVIGGIESSGLWQKIADSFRRESGIGIETAIAGTKHELDAYCRTHEVDLVTMHASDTMADLAADGFVEDLLPWARNSQMILAARGNPAGISREEPLEKALAKITASPAPFIVHASGGTFEVFGELAHTYGFRLPDERLRFTAAKRGFMNDVVAENGYTLYGVIPYLLQKQHHPMIDGYVYDDPKLRRPYLAAIGTEARIGAKRHEDAQKLLAFLVCDETQQMIKTFRIEGHENVPVFFPVKP